MAVPGSVSGRIPTEVSGICLGYFQCSWLGQLLVLALVQGPRHSAGRIPHNFDLLFEAYFLFALVLSGFSSKTLPVAAFNFIGEGATNWGGLMAAATLIPLPPLVLAFCVQRWLVHGLTVGAVKG